MSLPSTPEHIHTIIAHLPLVGVLAACIPMLIGFVTNSRGIMLAGLATALAFSAPTPFLMGAGESAEERFEAGVVQPPLDQNGREWLEVHSERGQSLGKVLYAPLAFSAVALVLAWPFKKTLRTLTGLILLISIGAVGVGLWVAEAGGKIRHPEARTIQEPPSPQPDASPEAVEAGEVGG